MRQFKTIVAATLTTFGLVLGGFVAIPSEGNAGMAASLTPAERVDGAFAAAANLDPALLAFSSGSTSTRTILIGYQTDLTGALLTRKPGA